MTRVDKPAIIFPGLGTQSVGMGLAWSKAYSAARETFEEVDESLHFNLSRLMFEGPTDELNLLQNAQPAIVASSIAALRALEKEGNFHLSDVASFVAGHSLGEYTALCAAGSLDLGNTLQILKMRGQAMQELSSQGLGKMAALIGDGVDLQAAQEIAAMASAKNQICFISNDNAPGQIVLSGHVETLERAAHFARQRNLKIVGINVDIPGHSPLMAATVEPIRDIIEKLNIPSPIIPWVSNSTATVVSNISSIPDLLIYQITTPVRWRESILYIEQQGIKAFIECGSSVLSSMTKRIAPDVTVLSMKHPESVPAALDLLNLEPNLRQNAARNRLTQRSQSIPKLTK